MLALRRIAFICISVWPGLAWASVAPSIDAAFVPHTQSLLGYAAIGVFVTAYSLVMLEDRLGLHKSIPVMLAGSIIWLLISMMTNTHGLPEAGVGEALHHVLEEYGSLFLFLLVAMTYVNALTERGVFAVLRAWLINRHFSFRQVYWCTGLVAFVLSPFADNLTTALVMGTVVMTVGHGHRRFIGLGAINIVVAANAGGVFSPFGDLTTLMIWEAGKVPTVAFGQLFVPAVVNYAVPALIMSTQLPGGRPVMGDDLTQAKPGAWFIQA